MRGTKDGYKSKNKDANEMDRLDYAILDYLVEHPKATTREMGGVFNVSRTTIHARMNRRIFSDHFRERMREISDLIKRAQKDAVRRLHKIVLESPEHIAINAARVLLLLENSDDFRTAANIVYATRLGPEGNLIQEKKAGKPENITTLDLIKNEEEEDDNLS